MFFFIVYLSSFYSFNILKFYLIEILNSKKFNKQTTILNHKLINLRISNYLMSVKKFHQSNNN